MEKTDYKKFDADYLCEDLSDLIEQKYRLWFIKRFYSLGRDEVLQLAAVAKTDGKNPKRLFAHLIGKASRKATK